jgi:hypothetical protein
MWRARSWFLLFPEEGEVVIAFKVHARDNPGYVIRGQRDAVEAG